MADQGDMDIKAHVATYGSVISLLYYGAIVCAIIAAVVIWLIS